MRTTAGCGRRPGWGLHTYRIQSDRRAGLYGDIPNFLSPVKTILSGDVPGTGDFLCPRPEKNLAILRLSAKDIPETSRGQDTVGD